MLNFSIFLNILFFATILLVSVVDTVQIKELKSKLQIIKEQAINNNHAYYTNDISGNSYLTWNNITNK